MWLCFTPNCSFGEIPKDGLIRGITQSYQPLTVKLAKSSAMLAAASQTYLQEYSVPIQIQTCLNCDPNIFEMCPKCCPKYFGYRSLGFFQQHSCNSVYMCVFLHVGSERLLPKEGKKILYYETLSFTFARKEV